MLTDAKFRVLVVLWSYVAKLGNDGSSGARGLATSRESATFARRPITARILDALIDFGFTDALGEDDWPRFADWPQSSSPTLCSRNGRRSPAFLAFSANVARGEIVAVRSISNARETDPQDRHSVRSTTSRSDRSSTSASHSPH
jgi:hypothetical protein